MELLGLQLFSYYPIILIAPKVTHLEVCRSCDHVRGPCKGFYNNVAIDRRLLKDVFFYTVEVPRHNLALKLCCCCFFFPFVQTASHL